MSITQRAGIGRSQRFRARTVLLIAPIRTIDLRVAHQFFRDTFSVLQALKLRRLALTLGQLVLPVRAVLPPVAPRRLGHTILQRRMRVAVEIIPRTRRLTAARLIRRVQAFPRPVAPIVNVEALGHVVDG